MDIVTTGVHSISKVAENVHGKNQEAAFYGTVGKTTVCVVIP